MTAKAEVQHLQTFIWKDDHPEVRAMSGLEVLGDDQFVAMSDFGHLLYGRFIREDGWIKHVQLDNVVALKDRAGAQLTGLHRDSEGLAITDTGAAIVGFEHTHRIAAFNPPSSAAKHIGDVGQIKGLSGNHGIEAVALHPDGSVFAISEAQVAGGFPIYRFDGQNWHVVMTLPATKGFVVVGADFDENGDLYVLERKFVIPFFASRIKRVNVATKQSETIWQSTLGRFDNLEGLAVWQDTAGRKRLTLIADDNEFFLQRTEIVELVLRD
ncbi:MAG: esterase-like activity of phytase family protein [Planktomarina sp.]